MKLIRIKKQIVSLENIREVKHVTHGSGAKSNPYYHVIEVYYTNASEKSYITIDSERESEMLMDKIMEILSAD